MANRLCIIIVLLCALILPFAQQIVEYIMFCPVDSFHAEKIPLLDYAGLVKTYAGKKALVIGGTRGIGLGIAKQIAKGGGSITFVGRSQSSCQSAIREVEQVASQRKKTQDQPSQLFDSLIYDVSLNKQLVNLTAQLAALAQQQPDKSRYDYLVLSVGVFPDWDDPINSEGIEKSFASQILSRTHVLLSAEQFLNPSASILNVLASGTRPPPQFFSDFGSDLKFGMEAIRGQKNFSNLGQVLGLTSRINDFVMYELERRWEGKNSLTLSGTHPGWVTTDLHVGQGQVMQFVFQVLDKLVCRTTDEAGLTQASILAYSTQQKDKLSFYTHEPYKRAMCSKALFQQYGGQVMAFLDSLMNSK